MPLMGIVLGVASLGIAGVTLALWWRRLMAVSLASDRQRFFMAWGIAAACGFAAFFHEPGWIGGSAAVLGIAMSAMFLGLGALSAQEARVPAVAVGELMLAFQAPTDSGEAFSSASLVGRPYLLKFFRGHW